jgi:hypothetical protein
MKPWWWLGACLLGVALWWIAWQVFDQVLGGPWGR